MERHGVTMTMFCVRAMINTPIAPSSSDEEERAPPKEPVQPIADPVAEAAARQVRQRQQQQHGQHQQQQATDLFAARAKLKTQLTAARL